MFEQSRTIDFTERIDSGSWRLKNIILEHTNGVDPKTKELLEEKVGWKSVWDDDLHKYVITEKETKNSSVTPFPSLILLVPPQLLGVHEATSPDHVPVENEAKGGFEGIDFSDGWHGSPLAVAAFTKCNGDEIIDRELYIAIGEKLLKNGGMGVFEGFDCGDLGILDGHHRRRYAAEGPIRLKYVPVQLIPFPHDKAVKLDTWKKDKVVWTAQQVFECFKTPGNYAVAKRTKFGVTGTDTITRRMLDTQPKITIPLNSLI